MDIHLNPSILSLKAILFAHRRPYLKIHPLKQLVNRHGFHLSILNDGKVLGKTISIKQEPFFRGDGRLQILNKILLLPPELVTKSLNLVTAVSGVKEDFDKNSVLEFNPSNPPGAYRIRGVESDLYLAMDNKVNSPDFETLSQFDSSEF